MGNGPASAKKIYLEVGVNPSTQVQSQMQVQQGRWRTRTHRRALFGDGFFPSCIGAVPCGAADGGVLVGELTIEHDLSG